MAVAAALTPLEAFLADPNIDERAEFLLGHAYDPMPESFLHLAQARFLEKALAAVFGQDRTVRDADLPLKESRPRPDVVVLREDFATYDRKIGYQGGDVVLVVEVCLTTPDRDYQMKDPLYAGAGIPEYWIVDLQGDRVERRTEPTPMGYAKHEVFFRGSSLLGIEIERMLGEPSREDTPPSV